MNSILPAANSYPPEFLSKFRGNVAHSLSNPSILKQMKMYLTLFMLTTFSYF